VVAARVGRSCRTVWRWAAQGCDLDNPDSVREFLTGNALRQSPNFGDPVIPNGDTRKPKHDSRAGATPDDQPMPELGPIGRRGAGAALERLEAVEERAHARLLQAIEEGDQFKTRAAQEFYLKSSEVLRRLDLAVLTERRQAGEQVPKYVAEGISRQISEWLRAAFEQFLSAESPGLMAIADLGEFKYRAIDRFKSILHMTVKNSLKTDSLIPEWAVDRIREAWNVH
jgi:hypothetical protein